MDRTSASAHRRSRRSFFRVLIGRMVPEIIGLLAFWFGLAVPIWFAFRSWSVLLLACRIAALICGLFSANRCWRTGPRLRGAALGGFR